MLYDYGFMNADQEDNRERLLLVEEEDDAELFFERKRLALLGGRKFTYLPAKIRGPYVMRIFRLVSAQTDDDLQQSIRATSWEREYTAAEVCQARLFKQIANKSTSIGKDYGLLYTTSSGRKRLAIQYRLEKKKVYIQTATFCYKVFHEILPCIPTHAVRYPKYMSMLRGMARLLHM